MSITGWYKRRSSTFKNSVMVVFCLGVVFATFVFVGCLWMNSGCTLLKVVGPGMSDAGSPPPAPSPSPPNDDISWMEVVTGAGVMALVGGGEVLRRKFFRRNK